MKRRSKHWSTLAIVCALFVSAVLAEELLVKVPTVVVREKKGAQSAIVGKVHDGEKLQVVLRDSDGWLRVSVAGKEGYVRETALVAPKTNLLGSIASGASAAGVARTSDVGASAAGSGIAPNEVALTYAAGKNYSPAGLTKMIDTREKVAGAKWEGFARQGQVGPYKK